MTWAYYPDGKLKARADDGVPVGQARRPGRQLRHPERRRARAPGPTRRTAPGKYGLRRTPPTPPAPAPSTFTWKLNIPQDGTYEVFVRYPQVTGAATDAKYTVDARRRQPRSRRSTRPTNAGTWVSAGLATPSPRATPPGVTLSDQADGTVRRRRGQAGPGQLRRAGQREERLRLPLRPQRQPDRDHGHVAGRRVDTYDVDLHRAQPGREGHARRSAGRSRTPPRSPTTRTAAPTATTHDQQHAKYAYDVRDLV